MSWFIKVLKDYAVFSGRAHRTEYWMFTLFYIIIYIVLAAAEVFIVQTPFIAATVFSLAVLLPYLGVTIRRLHDTNRSGWWILIALVPAIGAIVLLVFMVLDSEAGENRFGPNPKEA